MKEIAVIGASLIELHLEASKSVSFQHWNHASYTSEFAGSMWKTCLALDALEVGSIFTTILSSDAFGREFQSKIKEYRVELFDKIVDVPSPLNIYVEDELKTLKLSTLTPDFIFQKDHFLPYKQLGKCRYGVSDIVEDSLYEQLIEKMDTLWIISNYLPKKISNPTRFAIYLDTEKVKEFNLPIEIVIAELLDIGYGAVFLEEQGNIRIQAQQRWKNQEASFILSFEKKEEALAHFLNILLEGNTFEEGVRRLVLEH